MENQENVVVGQVETGTNQAEVISQSQAVPQASESVNYAGFWMRVGANFVDSTIITLLFWIANLIIVIIIGADNFKSGEADYVTVNIIEGAIALAYFVAMTHKYGGTLGKMVMGIKVISDKSQALSLWQVFVREISKIVSFLIIFIGYMMVGWTKRKQGLHDKFAKTLVVKVPGKKIKVWALVLGIIFNPIVFLLPLIILGILASVVLVGLNSARGISSDAEVRADMSSIMVQAIDYQITNNSFTGFQVPKINYPACSGMPIINISKDGNDLALFGKYCSEELKGKYYCADSNVKHADVQFDYINSGKTDCGVADIKTSN